MSVIDLSAIELRAKAEEHREAARGEPNPATRNARVKLAIECDRLAEVAERKIAANA